MFFSLITEEEGECLVWNTVRILLNLEFSFYKRIDPLFKADFLRIANKLLNVICMDVFGPIHSDVCAKTNKYDVYIFLIVHLYEDIPGVRTEIKTATIPASASDRCFNSDLAVDGVGGILNNGDTAAESVSVLAFLPEWSDLLVTTKRASLLSGEFYCIERYIDWAVREVAA